MMAVRKIIHIDMDAFFASVEIREDPSLAGKPIAVGFDGPRGVVCTASYEARKYGVRSALPMARAKHLCPGLIIVPCHFSLYKEVSRQVHDIFREYTDQIEPISLDEAFLDVTENKAGKDLAMDIAKEIKQKIRQRTGLTASAGVSYNKFLAKIASDFRKPDGLTVVHPRRALDFIASLPIEDFWGVGPKTAQKMHGLGIRTGAQLRAAPVGLLMSSFGKMGQVYHDFANGIDDRAVQPVRVRKSVGCEQTFMTDVTSKSEAIDELEALADDLMGRLQRSGFEGRTLVVKVKYHDFEQHTRSVSRTDGLFYTKRAEIMEAAAELLAGIEISAEKKVRLLGLTVTNPVLPLPPTPMSLQPTLFDHLPDDVF